MKKAVSMSLTFMMVLIMQLLLIYWTVISLCSMVVFIGQPYLLGLVLLMTSMFVCMIIGVNVSTFLALLLFMSYVGGLMVLFIYVLSVFPNEMYNFEVMGFMIVSVALMMSFLCFSMFPVKSQFLSVGSKKGLFHYMSFVGYWDVFVFMALFLLFIMMCVSYLVMKKRMPLRVNN
nr:NADH dehydrogenase subunit 6 [Perna canaliculus]